MTLADETVERYSRHILVPEIGPDGLRRLLETRVIVAGSMRTAAHAADLVSRSGLPLVRDVAQADVGLVLTERPTGPWPQPSVVAWATDDRLEAAWLAGAPCAACFDPEIDLARSSEGALGDALAALATTTLITGLLGASTGSSRTTLDLAAGRYAREPLTGVGCAHCRGRT